MSFISNVLLPVWVKPLALGILVLSLFGYGYYRGLASGEKELIAFQTQVSLAATKQDIKTAQHIIKQKDISNATQTRLARRLAAANKRLRSNTSDGASIVPAIPTAPTRVDEQTSDMVSTGTFNGLQQSYRQLYLDCTKTTIVADEWQRWAIENLNNSQSE